MTVEQAQRLLAEHGSLSAAANAAGMSRPCFTRWIRKAPSAKEPKVQPEASGFGKAFDLTKLRTATKKPVESVKSKLYQLPRGKGYPLADAAREWGVNQDTLRRHAKDIGAFLYAEVAPEQWVEVVTYPQH
jgi:transposase-like protein